MELWSLEFGWNCNLPNIVGFHFEASSPSFVIRCCSPLALTRKGWVRGYKLFSLGWTAFVLFFGSLIHKVAVAASADSCIGTCLCI